jgi:hypothetical protein
LGRLAILVKVKYSVRRWDENMRRKMSFDHADVFGAGADAGRSYHLLLFQPACQVLCTWSWLVAVTGETATYSSLQQVDVVLHPNSLCALGSPLRPRVVNLCGDSKTARQMKPATK